jgi:predicted amidohydrolase YtcJ
VTREGFEPQQALTPAEALHLYTGGAAQIQFEEHEKGMLARGLRADLVVLSESPLAVAPARIASIRVLRTVTGGAVVHDAEGG